MSNAPAPVRLADAARVAGKTAPTDYVWHFTLHRAGREPRTGERLATLALTPSDVAGYGRAELARTGIVAGSFEDAEAVGLRVLARALEAERREWVRRMNAAGYVDGYGVGLVTERGYKRSVFPGVGLAALAGARVAITPARGTPA